LKTLEVDFTHGMGYIIPMLMKSLFKYWTYQMFSPETVLREKYEAFKSLLECDKRAHELMAELEEIYHNRIRVDFKIVESKYEEFADSVSEIIDNLLKMCPGRYLSLQNYFKKFDFYIRFMLEPPAYDFAPPFTLSWEEIPADGLKLVGGKAFNLATIGRNLKPRIPDGFVITTNAFHYFLEYNDFRKIIDKKLLELDIHSPASLEAVSGEITQLIEDAPIPPDLADAVRHAFDKLKADKGPEPVVAVRSSAVGEDTRSSFAGQYKTVLNVNADQIVKAYKTVIASKYTSRALYYRINYGLSDTETPMAVLVLEMIPARSSGVVYTDGLEDANAEVLNIHSIWGLGELLVSGRTTPDIIKMKKGRPPQVADAIVGNKSHKLIYSPERGSEIVPVSEDERRSLSISTEAACELAEWSVKLESFYEEPQDIEWCQDESETLFLLQSRPLRTTEKKSTEPPECEFEDIDNPVLISTGQSASSGIGIGEVYKVDHGSSLENVPQGAVLVAPNASTRYVEVLDRLSAVVTDVGSVAGHFSSVAREFGIPALVDTGIATANLKTGRKVTVYADGNMVYDGIVEAMSDSPCARKNLLENSPFIRKMRYVLDFISPLELVDPRASNFVPEGCRSLHDIIRFSHETAVQEMFQLGNRRVRKIGGSKQLNYDIPMHFYVLDVGDGLKKSLTDPNAVGLEDITSVPLKAVLAGLGHSDIRWGEFSHFDWAEHDKIVMSGGIISPKAAMFASHAVVSRDYLNLNLRFGYHFVILDAICTDNPADNYVLFRFSGGGADMDKRILRADFLNQVLQRFGFDVNRRSDLVDARLEGAKRSTMEEKLDWVGRLLGATRLMDMYLKDESMVEGFVEDFMNGRYHFATVDE
jgi:pyruvate,water dikinase